KHDRPLLFPDITYSFYPTYAKLYDINYRTVPLADDFKIRIDDYTVANRGTVFPNPNAPTGHALPLADIEKLVAANPDSVVVIDEAYVDFGAQSAVSLIRRAPYLVGV